MTKNTSTIVKKSGRITLTDDQAQLLVLDDVRFFSFGSQEPVKNSTDLATNLNYNLGNNEAYSPSPRGEGGINTSGFPTHGEAKVLPASTYSHGPERIEYLFRTIS